MTQQPKNDPTKGWAWDPNRRVFMKQRVLSGEWEEAHVPFYLSNEPAYQYDPNRHPLYQDAVKSAEAKSRAGQMATDKENTTNSVIHYMSWSQNRNAQGEIDLYNHSYGLSPHDPGYLYMEDNAVKEREAAPVTPFKGPVMPQQQMQPQYNEGMNYADKFRPNFQWSQVTPTVEREVKPLPPQKGYWVKDAEDNFLFRLGEKNQIPDDTLTSKELYAKGLQWAAPGTENYIPLDSVSPNIRNIPTVKHINPEDFYKFANRSRFPFEYRTNGYGDWKESSRGADGHRLVEINGKPIWADLLGQVPFAVDTYKTMLAETGDPERAAQLTREVGYAFGTGSISDALLHEEKWDRRNNADNYWIQLAINYAKERYKPTWFRQSLPPNTKTGWKTNAFSFPLQNSFVKRTEKDLNSGIPFIDE